MTKDIIFAILWLYYDGEGLLGLNAERAPSPFLVDGIYYYKISLIMNGFPIKDFVKIVRELLTYLTETENVIPIDGNEVSERIKSWMICSNNVSA